MPYIKQEDRDAVVKDIRAIKTPGELNYVITRYLIKVWNDYPRYDTLHCFRRDFVVDPKKNALLQDLRMKLAADITTADVYAAAAEAYHEFRNRIGAAYEGKKIKENGDLPEYEIALANITAPAEASK